MVFISKIGPVEKINKVKDSMLKHMNAEAKKMGTLTSNKVSVTKLSWTKVNRDGIKEDKFGAHKVFINVTRSTTGS